MKTQSAGQSINPSELHAEPPEKLLKVTQALPPLLPETLDTEPTREDIPLNSVTLGEAGIAIALLETLFRILKPGSYGNDQAKMLAEVVMLVARNAEARIDPDDSIYLAKSMVNLLSGGTVRRDADPINLLTDALRRSLNVIDDYDLDIHSSYLSAAKFRDIAKVVHELQVSCQQDMSELAESLLLGSSETAGIEAKLLQKIHRTPKIDVVFEKRAKQLLATVSVVRLAGVVGGLIAKQLGSEDKAGTKWDYLETSEIRVKSFEIEKLQEAYAQETISARRIILNGYLHMDEQL